MARPFNEEDVGQCFCSSCQGNHQSPTHPVLPAVHRRVSFQCAGNLTVNDYVTNASRVSVTRGESREYVLTPCAFMEREFFPFNDRRISLSNRGHFIFLFVVRELPPLRLDPSHLPSPLGQLVLFRFRAFFRPVIYPFRDLVDGDIGNGQFGSTYFPTSIRYIPAVGARSLRQAGKGSGKPNKRRFSVSKFYGRRRLRRRAEGTRCHV